MASGKTFKRITNDEIYAEIQELKSMNQRQIEMYQKLDGKIGVVKWIGGTALTISLGMIGLLFDFYKRLKGG